jgi:hypothetical protein
VSTALLCRSCAIRLPNHECWEPETCSCDRDHAPLNPSLVAYEASDKERTRARWLVELGKVDEREPRGLICDRFEEITGIIHHSASPEMGYLRDTALCIEWLRDEQGDVITRLTRSGFPARVYVLTSLGRATLRTLASGGTVEWPPP